MTRYYKIIVVLLVVLVEPSFGQQGLFDCDNSKKFASYLYNTGQYELSQHELERIGFFCEIDSSSQLTLLKSYRKLKKYSGANLFFMPKTFDDLQDLSPEFRLEYVRLLMVQQEYKQVQQTIGQGLNFKGKNEHLLGTTLLLKQWEKAYQLGRSSIPDNNFKISGLKNIAERSHLVKRKKPWLATLMSVVVPGSGKIYSGYWGDGVVSFLFTASSSFFAYRAFDKYGTQKVYPWIVGGLAVSYYAANIYGGNRAAIHYNENLDHGFIHETEQLLYSDY